VNNKTDLYIIIKRIYKNMEKRDQLKNLINKYQDVYENLQSMSDNIKKENNEALNSLKDAILKMNEYIVCLKSELIEENNRIIDMNVEKLNLLQDNEEK